jgi:hypothetical protein
MQEFDTKISVLISNCPFTFEAIFIFITDPLCDTTEGLSKHMKTLLLELYGPLWTRHREGIQVQLISLIVILLKHTKWFFDSFASGLCP